MKVFKSKLFSYFFCLVSLLCLTMTSSLAIPDSNRLITEIINRSASNGEFANAILSYNTNDYAQSLAFKDKLYRQRKDQIVMSRNIYKDDCSATFNTIGKTYPTSVIEGRYSYSAGKKYVNLGMYSVNKEGWELLEEQGNYAFIPLTYAYQLISDEEKAKNNYSSLIGMKFSIKTKYLSEPKVFKIGGVFGYTNDKTYTAYNEVLSTFIVICEKDMDDVYCSTNFSVKLSSNRSVNTDFFGILSTSGLTNLRIKGSSGAQGALAKYLDSYLQIHESLGHKFIWISLYIIFILLYTFSMIRCFVMSDDRKFVGYKNMIFSYVVFLVPIFILFLLMRLVPIFNIGGITMLLCNRYSALTIFTCYHIAFLLYFIYRKVVKKARPIYCIEYEKITI